jgi:signal transduction histidine kinase
MADETPGTLQAEIARLREDYASLLRRLEGNQREFFRLARSVFRVQEDERRRLARELHDGIGQNLTALKHQLALLRDVLAPEQSQARERADLAGSLCARTLEETRELSRLLRPQVLDDLGLEAALRWLARTLVEAAGVRCTIRAEAPTDLDGDLQTLAFRLVQEALTNVVKHAQATHVQVRLHARAGLLRIEVEDDGRGCDPQAIRSGLGSGVGGMRERVRLHGGQFLFEARPGGGCRMQAAVPLDAESGGAQD